MSQTEERFVTGRGLAKRASWALIQPENRAPASALPHGKVDREPRDAGQQKTNDEHGEDRHA